MAGRSWGKSGSAKNWEGSRQYIGNERAVGILVDWQHKSGLSFGWIQPIHGLPSELRVTQHHGGDVYVNWRDILEPRPGAVVTFRPYIDKQGLGAEDCQNRRVLRFVVPKEPEPPLKLPSSRVNLCGQYLNSSVFFPDFEDRGVTCRKYLWQAGSLDVYELWGDPVELVAAAEEAGFTDHAQVEVLGSAHMVRDEPEECLREIAEDDLPNVPPRFRLALRLRADGAAQKTLLTLLGVETNCFQ